MSLFNGCSVTNTNSTNDTTTSSISVSNSCTGNSSNTSEETNNQLTNQLPSSPFLSPNSAMFNVMQSLSVESSDRTLNGGSSTTGASSAMVGGVHSSLESGLTNSVVRTYNSFNISDNLPNSCNNFSTATSSTISNHNNIINNNRTAPLINSSSTSWSRPSLQDVQPPSQTGNDSVIGQLNPSSPQWIEKLSAQIIEDMNRCGICVIDNFLGEFRCNVILNEVKSLYSSGHFRDGQLVNGRVNASSHEIRSDKIMWVDGTENGCSNISFLMRTLDRLIFHCTKLTPQGQLEKKNITNRTKAMLACYPGSGTHYVKHVDNPNQDGRCITCIYYLNKNWDVQKDGGLLRIFPKGLPYVANIAPLFDRLLFFYSDRRNPHEVQRAFAVRFAITLWYYDAEERDKHLKSYQREQLTPP